jgi:hypothetical protein
MSVLLVSNDSYSILPAAAIPVVTPPFSVALWIKLTATGTQMCPFAIGTDATTDHYHRLIMNSGGSILCSTRDTTSSNSTTGGAIGDNTTWHHMAGVWAAVNSRTAYLNATAATTNTGNRTGVTTPTGMRIGENMNSGDDVNARVGYLGIWASALSGANITSLYGSGTNGADPTTVDGANLVALYTFVVNANDSVGSFTLTPKGTPTIDADNPPVVIAGTGHPAARRGGLSRFQRSVELGRQGVNIFREFVQSPTGLLMPEYGVR